jgi:3-methyl-2-oxobutanoate hydroxymethyltransferase
MKKMSVLDLLHKKRKQQPISMVTAYDYPSALHVDLAGIDIVLCGDSVAMVELGYPTTQPVNMEQMLHHCKAVARGAKRSLIVGDMPFGSYEVSEELAMTNAFRFIKEGFTDAVKIEGGRDRANIVQKIVKGGIAVMGHIGLTPQAISVLGGFRAQGRTAVKARRLVDDALALQDAGAFAVVIECVPGPVAQAITNALEIPTIGIGAGPHTSGQVLVYHDMLGMTSHPHHEAFVPRFCKRYAQLGDAIRSGLEAFKKDVEEGTFPSEAYSPYKMPKEELDAFLTLMAKDAAARKAQAEEAAERLKQSDEYEQIKLY